MLPESGPQTNGGRSLPCVARGSERQKQNEAGELRSVCGHDHGKDQGEAENF